MADEAVQSAAPEEQEPEITEKVSKSAKASGPKDAKPPSARFGSLLMLGRDAWTVRESDKGGVTVMRRVGNVMEERRLTMDEYKKAKAVKVPQDIRAKGNAWFGRGLGMDVNVTIPDALGGSARISGYDAASGEVQLDIPGRGPTWVARGAVQDLLLSDGDREAGAKKLFETLGVERVTKAPTRKLTSKKTPVSESESKTVGVPASTPASTSRTVQVPVVQIPTVVSEPASMSMSTDALEEISPTTSSAVEIKNVTQDAPVTQVARTPPSTDAQVSVKLEVPQQSIRETREQMKVDVQAVAAQQPQAKPAPALGRAGEALAAVDAFAELIHSPAAGGAAAGAAQQQLYARAASALDMVQSRIGERRGSIQGMQQQADGLRQEIANINAQAAAPSQGVYRAPEMTGRLAEAQKELGSVQNRLAMARYQQQTDEAQAQQLQISVGLMQNAAPEVQAGQLPKALVAMIERSIPAGTPTVPQPSEPQMTVPKSEVRPSRSYASAPPTQLERPVSRTEAVASGGIAESVRQRLSGAGMRMPEATAIGLLSAQQADRTMAGGGYQEGLGAPDAQTAAYAQEGAGPRPVIDTIPATYGRPKSEEAEDVFESGSGASAEFMRQQQQAQATQEQFLPGSTGGVAGPAFETEIQRGQQVRPRPESEPEPDADALKAAALQAQQAQTRAAAMRLFGAQQDETEKENIAQSVQKKLKQAEQVRKVFSVLLDMFDAATIEDILGGIMLILNMNGRVLTALAFRNPKSLMRKILPAANFPWEMAAILSVDLIVLTIVFLAACAFLLPLFIIAGLSVIGIAGFIEFLT